MEELKQKRQSIKGSITRICTHCQNVNVTFDELTVRVDKLEALYKDYERIQDSIDILTSPENMNVEENYRSDIEEKYFLIKALFSAKFREEQSENTVIENQNQTDQIANVSHAMQALLEHQNTLGVLVERLVEPRAGANSTPVSQRVDSSQEIRLPRIQIPEFDGTYINWLHFRDLFEVMVHSKSNLADIEKFEYLLTKLKGDALSLVKHLKPTNDNYKIAWELLQGKYNESDKVKKAYLSLLLDQQSVKVANLVDIKRLYNNTNEGINALKALGEAVDHWDTMLLYMFEKKLDPETSTLWFRCRSTEKGGTFKQLMQFLEQRIFELESTATSSLNKSYTKTLNTQNNVGRQPWQSKVYSLQPKQCVVCEESHPIYQCEEFKQKPITERIKIVRNNNLCFNCFKEDHRAFNCKSSACRVCSQKHNSLLHLAYDNKRETGINMQSNQVTSASVNSIRASNKSVNLLPTAMVNVLDKNNQYQKCRVLLDSGAQVSLIREACIQRLGLKRKYNNTLIHGVGNGVSSQCRGEVEFKIASSRSSDTITSTAYCLSNLTQDLPGLAVHSEKISYFKHLDLADEGYGTPGSIDIILGADVFANCILNGKVVHPSGSPTAIETIFGWVLLGKVECSQPFRIFVSHVALDLQLQKFWEVEEIPPITQVLTSEEQQAEEHYVKYVKRELDGRYVVRLPFKDAIIEFGDSKSAALKRLNLMERRFQRNEKLEEDYKNFMHEYTMLNHMKRIIEQNAQTEYYLPHHAVFKPSSTTTKMRVVFDASCKSSNGKSLNDQLLVGYSVQKDLFQLLLQFRKYKVGFTSDIEKMYRQILVHEDDRCYQRILWRETLNDDVAAYNLRTVTYGTACAPFLATRTLKQIGIENMHKFPQASNAVINCFYVDDFMFCAEDLDSAIALKDDVCRILKEAGFHLRKWCSNSADFMSVIDPIDREMSEETIIDDTQTIKTLGLLWDTKSDSFRYSIALRELQSQVTKRTVLSDISKIFDPLGWLSPIVIAMKVFMQRLWLKGVGWDDELPYDMYIQWCELRSCIQGIDSIRIPRWVEYHKGELVELHGFADASEVAYSAVVYIKVRHFDGSVSTNLLAAKTRVAPIKQITLPRLELCAAQLLTKLMVKVKQTLENYQVPLFGYSDSAIVLAWLSDFPRRWKTFIANRTSYIIDIIPRKFWYHIPSQQNPADLATRGMNACQLLDNNLWWHGPSILHSEEGSTHVTLDPNITAHLEERHIEICHISEVQEYDLFERFSNFSKLLSVTAYMLRFITNCKELSGNRVTGPLNVSELNNAHDVLIRKAQMESFPTEIRNLLAGKSLSVKHKLSALTPFVDQNQLLRVGGRVENANITYDQKHPLILSKESIVTKLLIRYYHSKHLHAGSRQLQYLLGIKYWIPGVIKVIKQCIYQCTRCMRFRAKPFQQQMSCLPKHRVEMTSPFVNTGVDFAGPIQVRSWRGRGSKLYKCWIAVFVCLVTKAIHLELVSELSTASFLATLRRFVSRRGKPLHIYSDNGTNFVGCNQQLKEIRNFLQETSTKDHISRSMSEQQIQWHFIPPSGPHFGGMWEAGVKSTKYHLKRVLADSAITFEEMYTVLCQIECCLNSRPLCLKFEGDTDPLTPGHFLIFRALSAVPDTDCTLTKVNLLNRWQYIQRLVQQFWKKWSLEYISQLQQRPKWAQKLKNINNGDMIIIKDDTLPPSKWAIGQVVETFAGKDGLVRVVSVKTSKGIFKRPITKLCPLFLEF